MPENKVKFGLKRMAYAKMTYGEDGSKGYADPVLLPGAVNLSLDPQGESVEFYADDILYYASSSNAGYQGNLEMAYISDQFRKDIFGDVVDPETGVLFENAAAEPAHFALLFEFSGDKHTVRHTMYDCVAARPAVASGTTSKTKEPVTSSMQITSAPREDGIVKASTTSKTKPEIYNKWYESVVEPPADLLTGGGAAAVPEEPTAPAAAKTAKQ